MMLSLVWFSRIYSILAEKQIKMPELETLFMLVNAVLYEYWPILCSYEYCLSMAPKNGHSPI